MDQQGLSDEPMRRIVAPEDDVNNTQLYNVQADDSAEPSVARHYNSKLRQRSGARQVNSSLSGTLVTSPHHAGLIFPRGRHYGWSRPRCAVCFPQKSSFTSPRLAARAPFAVRRITADERRPLSRERTTRLPATSSARIDRLARPTRSGVLRAEHMARQRHAQAEAVSSIHVDHREGTGRAPNSHVTGSRSSDRPATPPARLTKGAKFMRQNAKRMNEVEEEQQPTYDEEEEIGLGFRSVTSGPPPINERTLGPVNKKCPATPAQVVAPPSPFTRTRRRRSLVDKLYGPPPPALWRGMRMQPSASCARQPDKPSRGDREPPTVHRNPAQQQQSTSSVSWGTSIDLDTGAAPTVAAVQNAECGGSSGSGVTISVPVLLCTSSGHQGILSVTSSSLSSPTTANPSRRAALLRDARQTPLRFDPDGSDGAAGVPTQRKTLFISQDSSSGSLASSMVGAAETAFGFEAALPGMGAADQFITTGQRPCAPVPPVRSPLSKTLGGSTSLIAWSAASPTFASPNMSVAGAHDDLALAFGARTKLCPTPPIRPRYFHTDM